GHHALHGVRDRAAVHRARAGARVHHRGGRACLRGGRPGLRMRIRIRLFAMQRQQLGWKDRELECPDGLTVAGAWQMLVDAYPALGPAATSIRFARNGAYADATEGLVDGDELALIPPVAGGAGMTS